MNIDDLKTFVAIARAGGVHAASERLHKTQPAISKALRRLEEQIGIQLMDRSGYRAATTDAGSALLRRAELVLGQMARLESFVASLARGQEERIRIAVHSALPDETWTPYVAVATAQFPDTIVNITREEVTGAVRRLELEEVDLAITPWDVREADSLNDVYEIGSLDVVNIVVAEAFYKGESAPTDLCRTLHQVVVVDSVADDGLTYGVFEGERQIRVPDQITKASLIRQGLGWGRVPRHLVADDLANGKLVEFAAANQLAAMKFPVYCIKLKTRDMGPVMGAIWTCALEASIKRAADTDQKTT